MQHPHFNPPLLDRGRVLHPQADKARFEQRAAAERAAFQADAATRISALELQLRAHRHSASEAIADLSSAMHHATLLERARSEADVTAQVLALEVASLEGRGARELRTRLEALEDSILVLDATAPLRAGGVLDRATRAQWAHDRHGLAADSGNTDSQHPALARPADTAAASVLRGAAAALGGGGSSWYAPGHQHGPSERAALQREAARVDLPWYAGCGSASGLSRAPPSPTAAGVSPQAQILRAGPAVPRAPHPIAPSPRALPFAACSY
jgi:hypothetical protein